MTTIIIDEVHKTIGELEKMIGSKVYPSRIYARHENHEITFTYQHHDMYSMSVVIYPKNSALPRANACVGIYANDILEEINKM